jgi:hypothetical protein
MTTDRTLEFYPTGDDKGLYYVEFGQWPGKDMTWQLFQRQFMYDEEEWERMKKEAPNDFLLMSNEVHPWNLGEGTVDSREHAMSMNTKKFLCFMVDALNDKVNRIQRKRKMDEWLAQLPEPNEETEPLSEPTTDVALKVDKDALESTLALAPEVESFMTAADKMVSKMYGEVEIEKKIVVVDKLTTEDDVLSKLVDTRPGKMV